MKQIFEKTFVPTHFFSSITQQVDIWLVARSPKYIIIVILIIKISIIIVIINIGINFYYSYYYKC